MIQNCSIWSLEWYSRDPRQVIQCLFHKVLLTVSLDVSHVKQYSSRDPCQVIQCLLHKVLLTVSLDVSHVKQPCITAREWYSHCVTCREWYSRDPRQVIQCCFTFLDGYCSTVQCYSTVLQYSATVQCYSTHQEKRTHIK